ncbi:hypothetical protein RHGRI_016718 [Rhododendron griersonianum]|uniref:Uncharacterized protein n=1 Tax=Rhododendron griersonianum TaxID=479676 RepID=A0AAV6JV74_9ERIC|nr:hypothetical protein RHGRI_016718 [Rhododendron griersonianum]
MRHELSKASDASRRLQALSLVLHRFFAASQLTGKKELNEFFERLPLAGHVVMEEQLPLAANGKEDHIFPKTRPVSYRIFPPVAARDFPRIRYLWKGRREEGSDLSSLNTTPVVIDRSVGLSTPREKSIHEAIQKLDRRSKRLRRKNNKKKSLSDFGLKAAKGKKNNKVVSFSSLSYGDIRNRNSLLVMKARKYMETGALLGVKYHGGENFNIVKYIELEEGEISDKELGDLMIWRKLWQGCITRSLVSLVGFALPFSRS